MYLNYSSLQLKLFYPHGVPIFKHSIIPVFTEWLSIFGFLNDKYWISLDVKITTVYAISSKCKIIEQYRLFMILFPTYKILQFRFKSQIDLFASFSDYFLTRAFLQLRYSGVTRPFSPENHSLNVWRWDKVQNAHY